MAVAPTYYIEGLNEMLRAISRIAGPEGSRNLREGAKDIAAKVAADARGKASTSQQRLGASAGINAKFDRIPTIRMGSARRVTRSTPGKGRNPTASDVIFGSDFGSDQLRQFPPSVRGGRMLFPAIRDNRRYIADQYLDRIEDMWAERFSVGSVSSGGAVSGF